MKSRKSRLTGRALALSCLIAILAVSGCTRNPSEGSTGTISNPGEGAIASSGGRDSGMSFPMGFDSIESLARNADLIIVGTATEDVWNERILDLETRVVAVDVDEVLARRPSTDTPKVVPIAQENALFEGVDIRLVSGDTYVLFLQHFEFERGKPVGDNYVILGGSTGAFRFADESSDSASTISSLDRGFGLDRVSGISLASLRSDLATIDMSAPRSGTR